MPGDLPSTLDPYRTSTLETRFPLMLRVSALLGFIVLSPGFLMAQPPTTSSAAAPVPRCSPSAMAITIPIIDDATDAPLRSDAIIVTVTRAASGTRLRNATELPVDPPGRWVLLTDGDLGAIASSGESIVVEVLRGGQARVRRELRVGRDSARCELRLLDAPAALRVP